MCVCMHVQIFFYILKLNAKSILRVASILQYYGTFYKPCFLDI